ncbi:LysR family transcriptional regulator [Hylemonella gracilis str. Niagara R]|uniref:LysR family transcriptional regulator n=1 Tax=Hylemonella gracilis str. Niagara R TaxID=1458275 RepID=A0A016XLG2_9BURK|nr:LysR substrate-binding domain-containing protein [Hylemonella gracilis]EYC52417.1 LysR family transcriptional regulator [Hylemonella gracilis str. Niagara R]
MNLLVSMRYLVALDEHKHFARAAQACFVTQPALSNALRALEEEFGSPIVRRGRTFVGFTPEGERLLESARRMLREEQLLKQDLKSVGGRIQGRLGIGVVPSAEPIAARFAAMLQARHLGITPVVRSMSSQDIESGLEDLTLDMGLGFIERVRPGALQTLPQYVEHYFLVRRLDASAELSAAEAGLRFGPPMDWREAAALPLCLMSPEMYNRHILDDAFAQAGVRVRPVMETNSVLSLALAAVGGSVSSIMPGALVGAVRTYRELEARPLGKPTMQTPIGFMVQNPARNTQDRRSRPLEAALALAQDPEWLHHAAAHSGALQV